MLNGIDLSKIKINWNAIENVFIDAVKDQAEIHKVQPNELAVRIFPEELQHVQGEYGINARVTSLTGAFEEEVKPLKEITFYDQGNHISMTFIRIFQDLIFTHNKAVGQQLVTDTTENYSGTIDWDKLELFVEVKILDGKEQLDMNMVYDFNRLKKWDIKEEFKDAQDLLKEM